MSQSKSKKAVKKAKKSPKVRRYAVAWKTYYLGFERRLTLHANNKKEAEKLVAAANPAQGKYKVTVLR